LSIFRAKKGLEISCLAELQKRLQTLILMLIRTLLFWSSDLTVSIAKKSCEFGCFLDLENGLQLLGLTGL
jgi:hypothetical protein